MQAHHQSLAHSESSEILNHQHIPPHDSMYHQNNMYVSIPDNVHNIHPDYAVEHESRKFQQHQQHKLDNFSNNFRSNNFNHYAATRPRHQTTRSNLPSSNQFRDTPSYFPTSSAEVFPPSMTSPVQPHLQPFESRGSYDFGAQMNVNGLGPKNFVDMYSPANLLPSHQVNGSKSHHQQQQQQPQHPAYSAPYSNGPHLSSQTPYGPHVPAAAASSAMNGTSAGTTPGGPPGLAPPANTSTTNPANSSANTEEISTIFVVGFPEDMQEREFQNMFTFSPDFEAATLKIPNKEYTAYGGVVGGGPGGSAALRSGFSGFGGPNDPYNLVTVNQGGVVVDGGRDGTMASWPATVPGEDLAGMPFLGGALSGGNVPGINMPPRKQIIGFAKFKTRDAALQARDGLQGRRVDIDKGAVLKAEMAKKNLHTKRGVGPVPGGTSSGPTNVTGTSASGHSGGPGAGPLQQSLSNGTVLGAGGPEAYGIGTEGIVNGNGLGTGRLTQWRDQIHQQHDHIHSAGPHGISAPDREEDDRRGILNTIGGLGSFGPTTRGPRERAEDDERERRRKDKDMMRLRAGNTTAFDAFHSVPPGPVPLNQSSRHMVGQAGAMLSSAESETATGTSPMINGLVGPRLIQQQHDELPGPWDNLRNRGGRRPRSSSQCSTSPPLPTNGNMFDMPPRSFSPAEHQQFFEPSRHDPQYTAPRVNHASSESSSSSVIGGPQSYGQSATGGSDGHGTEAELSRALGGLDVNAEGGKTSPQLPSPASGASSRNGVDQNPPINTLYVGNLPTSPPPNGFPQDYLEESLRELFSSRAGFRRLCFRHKSNGPMCFVEFEDVPYATKALNELYGNNLKGLVKGGIRLSYSKNPLGVRTPTSAGSNGPSLQQQQTQGTNNNSAPNNSYTSPMAPEFQPRSEEQQLRAAPMILRRDMVSSVPAHQSFASELLASSPPPPRFFSSSPSGFAASSGSTSLTGTSNAFIPRYGFGMSNSSHGQPSATFSPFGLSNTPPPHSTIPDNQTNSDGHLSSSHSQHFHNNFAPANNLEAARAG